MARLGLPQSDDTILRHLKHHMAAQGRGENVRIIGIDDWAWRKGSTYGTIIVDLSQRRVLDIMQNRSAATTAQWFKMHPDVEIVSRDRCGLYAQGARKGSPDARQVADRFRLLQNLRHTIEQQLSRAPQRSCPTRIIGGSISPPAEEPDPAEHQWSAATGRRAIWQAKFDRVKELQAEGTNPVGIVRATGMNWRTVAGWMRSQALPGRNMMAPKLTTPACFHDHLAARWSEGCTLGRVLLAEIKELGYTGSFSHLARFLANWRRAGRVVIAETSVMDEVEFAPPSPPAVPPIVARPCV
jgi:transposase